MRFAYLGSGSQGNGLVVEADGARLLLDCGFTVTETIGRLARLGLQPSDLDAIVVTHEHDDHIRGVSSFSRRFSIPVWATHGTVRGARDGFRGVTLHRIDGYREFAIGGLHVQPYPVPHDAGEPAQFVFSDGRLRFGVLTDVGCATPHIQSVLSGCDALALECNHDPEMLRGGPYPESLKRRVGGRFGHLSNEAAGALLASLDRSRLQHVVAVHLSLKNNTPALARAPLAAVLGCDPDWIAAADQFTGLDWRDIR